MPRKRSQCAPLAFAPDGSVLLNVSAQLDPALLLRVAQALVIKPADLFIGATLAPAQRAVALARIDDAAAEAAARIQADAAPAPSPKRSRR